MRYVKFALSVLWVALLFAICFLFKPSLLDADALWD